MAEVEVEPPRWASGVACAVAAADPPTTGVVLCAADDGAVTVRLSGSAEPAVLAAADLQPLPAAVGLKLHGPRGPGLAQAYNATARTYTVVYDGSGDACEVPAADVDGRPAALAAALSATVARHAHAFAAAASSRENVEYAAAAAAAAETAANAAAAAARTAAATAVEVTNDTPEAAAAAAAAVADELSVIGTQATGLDQGHLEAAATDTLAQIDAYAAAATDTLANTDFAAVVGEEGAASGNRALEAVTSGSTKLYKRASNLWERAAAAAAPLAAAGTPAAAAPPAKPRLGAKARKVSKAALPDAAATADDGLLADREAAAAKGRELWALAAGRMRARTTEVGGVSALETALSAYLQKVLTVAADTATADGTGTESQDKAAVVAAQAVSSLRRLVEDGIGGAEAAKRILQTATDGDTVDQAVDALEERLGSLLELAMPPPGAAAATAVVADADADAEAFAALSTLSAAAWKAADGELDEAAYAELSSGLVDAVVRCAARGALRSAGMTREALRALLNGHEDYVDASVTSAGAAMLDSVFLIADGERTASALFTETLEALGSEAVLARIAGGVSAAESAADSLDALGSSQTALSAAAAAADAKQKVAFERSLARAVVGLDANALVADAEGALEHEDRRVALLARVTDVALEFLLQYLPHIVIPDVTGEQDGIEYSVSDLSMSGFGLQKEDVDVSYGDALKGEPLIVVRAVNVTAVFNQLKWTYKQSYFPYMEGEGVADARVVDGAVNLGMGIRKRRKRARADMGADAPPPPPPPPLGRAATAPSKLEGNGAEQHEPVMALTSRTVTIGGLELAVDDCQLAWLYNMLAALFKDFIRGYICSVLVDAIRENGSELLEPLNQMAANYGAFGMLLKASGLELAQLPLVETLVDGDDFGGFDDDDDDDVLSTTSSSSSASSLGFGGRSPSGRSRSRSPTPPVVSKYAGGSISLYANGSAIVELIVAAEGELGLELDVRASSLKNGDSGKGALLRIRSLLPGGAAAAASRLLSVRPGEKPTAATNACPPLVPLEGMYIVGLNGNRVSDLAPRRVLDLLREAPRPLKILLRKKAPSAARSAAAAPSPAAASPKKRPSVSGAPSAQVRTYDETFNANSLGLKLKPSPTVIGGCEVSGFSRAPSGDLLPAEAGGKVRKRDLLFAIDGVPVHGLGFKPIAAGLKSNFAASRETGRPLVLTFVENPDVVLDCVAHGPPDDLRLGLMGEAPRTYLVVTALRSEPGPLEATGDVDVGDILTSVNGAVVPTGGGFAKDMDLLRHCTYPLTVGLKRPIAGKAPSGETVFLPDHHVTLAARPKDGKLCVNFGKQRTTGDIRVRSFARCPGNLESAAAAAAAAAGGHSQLAIGVGFVLLKVGEAVVDPSAQSIPDLMAALLATPQELTFRQMDKYLDLRGRAAEGAL